jgi:hypothetical protein
MFNPAIDGRVGSGEVALDAGPPYAGVVGRLYVANLTADGLDASRPILAYPAGTGIILQDRGNAAIYVSLVTTGRGAARKGYVEIPVTCSEAGAVGGVGIVAGAAELFFVPALGIVAVAAVAADPLLVTLETAKVHLRVTDTGHDPDITQKLAASSAAIRDYLKDRNDPTWTADTVPAYVAAAVLFLLAHVYEHRGDEFGADSDNDDRVWSAIANLCRRARDPALA